MVENLIIWLMTFYPLTTFTIIIVLVGLLSVMWVTHITLKLSVLWVERKERKKKHQSQNHK